ncbi:hypothetical protein O9H85_31595 [Paenibacillus filicis]|uniref:DUF7694 domain-containing protein n=1 Tax=Paenibacillus gyeongsangnamensis TaxID=3388067 RepID=A0ABT4QJ04_9BACL|nr:hypothetical protein [Paenibacillus filicis]MCZ8516830.1 hypothetical protein [Paenibacillus filicis]
MKNWIGKPSPKSMRVGMGWFGEMNKAFSDGKYAVMTRTIETEWGTIEHACMRNAVNSDIPWAEKQRIKNELFGPDRTAIEVFPAEVDLVDEANMYHIWILPRGMKLPFGL